jgi:hypothetical protein
MLTEIPREFGFVGRNDWPLKVAAKFKIYGEGANRMWDTGRHPWGLIFCGIGAAQRELKRMYKLSLKEGAKC